MKYKAKEKPIPPADDLTFDLGDRVPRELVDVLRTLFPELDPVAAYREMRRLLDDGWLRIGLMSSQGDAADGRRGVPASLNMRLH